MTVAELIEKLQGEDPEAEVMIRDSEWDLLDSVTEVTYTTVRRLDPKDARKLIETQVVELV